jgi:hypothetical protein
MASFVRQKVSSREEAISSSSLVRGSGLAAILGGISWLLLVPVITLTYPGRTGCSSLQTVFSLGWEDYNKLLPAVLLLLVVGLAGLTAQYGPRSGKLGRAGLVVALFGLGLMFLGSVGEFWLAGGIRTGITSGVLLGWMSYSLGYLLLSVGMVLLGIAALRKRVLAYGNAVPLILRLLGLPVFLTVTSGVTLGVVLVAFFGLGWVSLGYTLWSGKGKQYSSPRM